MLKKDENREENPTSEKVNRHSQAKISCHQIHLTIPLSLSVYSIYNSHAKVKLRFC